MEKLAPALEFHVFVCQNERPPGHPRGCCKERGSEALLQALKSEAAARGIASQGRIQKSGCLDVCEQGAALVIYSQKSPKGHWYGKVTLADVPAVVDQLTARQ